MANVLCLFEKKGMSSAHNSEFLITSWKSAPEYAVLQKLQLETVLI